jgi:hypothetical protein
VDYTDIALSGGAQMYLLGWTGDFGDPDNFVGTFFQASPRSGATTTPRSATCSTRPRPRPTRTPGWSSTRKPTG